MSDWVEDVATAIGAATGHPCTLANPRSIGGGCINSAYAVDAGERRFFVKINRAQRLAMFEAELAGLAELAATQTVRVPAPICAGTSGDHAFLAMEFLQLDGNGRGSAERLGHQLAALHRSSSDCFGWQRDNTIGSTPQINTPSTDWIDFWREHRLGYQLRLAARNGSGARLIDRGNRLKELVPGLFADYAPQPSLLHGDLWGGNWATTAGGEPVLFDPAVYFGDRETDLAMTELFGGFPPTFYAAYKSSWPLDSGYSVRKQLYNLYHVLNHLNLFGGGYQRQAETLIERLTAELR
ncbi:MAG: fructosamine kinase family protein [Proteobacteria bacterium]|nr:MAG: fructosamine kinase family protein [Pseudomonadota bacterium]QKK10938.1 MAG: fructosamine kinase family protein [Pseudomonadota bacterium]